MKKIINGKKYDTATAQLLTMKEDSVNGAPTSYCLYRKKNGEFFTFFEMIHKDETVYRELHPYSVEGAKEYIERYFNDKYEEIFGEVEE